MATKRDTDLFQALRAAGLRKKVAHTVTDATRKTRPGKQSKLLVRTIENLHTSAAAIERRADGNKRTEAAKQAAQTRKRKAAARSTVADKAAQTRTDTEA
jgi:hypothetical protein